MNATHSRLRRWSPWIAVIVFVIAAFAMDRVLGHYHWAEVLSSLQAISLSAQLSAGVLALGSYLVLSLYDFLGVRNAGGNLRWRTVAVASFTAYAIAHSVGFATLSGGSVRYRIYTKVGLSGLQVAQVIAFCTLTFALGAATLGGLSLALRAEQAAPLLHISANVARGVGWGLVSLVALYVGTGSLRHQPLRLRGVQIQLPGAGLSLVQVLVATLELGFAAGVLYVLMPPNATDGYLAFLAAYLLAAGAGLVSTVPGGLGVFESVVLLLTPHGNAEQKLAAILAFRVIYYLVPFMLAAVVMLGHEGWHALPPRARDQDHREVD